MMGQSESANEEVSHECQQVIGASLGKASHFACEVREKDDRASERASEKVGHVECQPVRGARGRPWAGPRTWPLRCVRKHYRAD